MNDTNVLMSRRAALAFLASFASIAAGCKTVSGQSVAPSSNCLPVAHGPSSLCIDVLFDRTTALSGHVAAKVINGMADLVRPDDLVRIIRFGGRQEELLGNVDEIGIGGKTDRWRDSPNKVLRSKACGQQSRIALSQALQGAFADYDNAQDGTSPIFEALAAVAESWKRSDGERLCILCSDGVQHSAVASFIGKGSVSLALPESAALEARLRLLGLVPPNLVNASFIHVGFGSGDGPTGTRRSRSSVELIALRKLWQDGYWEAAGASSIVFGMPLPLDGLSVRRT